MTALAMTEAAALAEHEAAVERGLATFLDVGRALLAIRDARLYRAKHDTFESYCESRWGMSKSHANRMVQAAEVAEAMTPIGVTPTSESQARELAPLLDEPERLREVWTEAVEQTAGKPTAAVIRDIVRPPIRQVETHTTKTEVIVDQDTGEVLTPQEWAETETERQVVNPLAAARADVARQPVIVAGKAIERLHSARLTFEAVGSPADLVADIALDPAELDNSGYWLDEIESAIAVLQAFSVALRRRNIRSAK